MKKLLFIFLFLGVFSVAFAQNAEVMSEVLSSPVCTSKNIAYYVACATQRIDDTQSPDEAFELLKNSNLLPKDAQPDTLITYKNLAYICMSLWNIQGGICWNLFKTPRYAFNELKAKNLIDAFTFPNEKVSGRDALFILGECSTYGDRDR